MRRSIVTLALALTTSTLAAAPSFAALMELPGDSTITLDTATNLEFLDLTQTIGMSANQALATSFATVDGFRLATQAEVESLFINAGLGPAFPDANNVANNASVNTLLNLVGCTQFCGTVNATGRGFAISTGNSAFLSRPEYHLSGLGGGASTASLLTSDFDTMVSTQAVWLVRDHAVAPVPEPNSALLFAVGCLVLQRSLRKRA